MLPRPLVMLLVLLVTSAAQGAGAQDAAAARAVADSFFHMVADERYLDAARLMDLESLDVHRRATIQFAHHPMERRRMTASEFLKFDPKMPRAVAEYQAKQFNERPFDMAPLYRREFGVSTLDSVAALSAEELAARALAANDIRTMMRESIRRNTVQCAVTAAERAQVLARIRVRPSRIIGVVTDDSVAYVLYDRHDFDAFEPPPDSAAPSRKSAVPIPTNASGREWVAMPPAFLLLRRVGTGWRVGASIGSEGMAYVSGCARGKGKAGK